LYILMFIISFFLAADASVLIFNPSLYRKSLNYINETLGPIWGVLYGLLFSFCAIFVFISVIFSGLSVPFIIASLVMAAIGLFFLLCETQKFGYLAQIWIKLSDNQYRIAGVIFVVIASLVCYIAATIHYNL
jgi:uncharacterized protein YjeT (DUF2065 family)